MNHPLLYEINTRCWLAELSASAGRRITLADVPESEFDSWQSAGFTHLWLMGVWTLGARGRAWSKRSYHGRETELRCAEIAGSPYAITAYAVSRKLGGEGGLAAFRRRLRSRGIKLLLDFIPNHTALDHPWSKSHPGFFVSSESHRPGTIKPHRAASAWFAHGDCGHGSPWVDTLQLDYRHPELRQAMTDELETIANRCDGVRCDMAMLVLNDVFVRTWRNFSCPHRAPGTEFWLEAIQAVRRQHPDFLFLAEAYWDLEARLQELGFDFTYDKRLYDRLLARDAGEVTKYLASLAPGFLSRSAHFLENHDEPRIASLLSFEEHRAAALLILALPGMRFLHEGQLRGSRIHANVHFARRLLENAEDRIGDFYKGLLGVLPLTSVGRGSWRLLDVESSAPGNSSHGNIVVVHWQSAPGFDLAVINLGSTRSQCFARMEGDALQRSNWRLTDLLGDEVHEREGTELAARGLYLDLPPHAAQLFHVTKV